MSNESNSVLWALIDFINALHPAIELGAGIQHIHINIGPMVNPFLGQFAGFGDGFFAAGFFADYSLPLFKMRTAGDLFKKSPLTPLC
ncbi:MAG: hypothetical protein WCS87_19325 [Methylococcaceae bacterium]